MEKKKPLLSIRPHFDPGLAVYESVPATLLSVVMGTGVIGTFLYIIFSFIGLGKFISGGAIYLCVFLLCLALTPAVFYEVKRRAFARTAFHFYDGYLEYQNFRFYINRRRGRVRYDDIADVTQRASFLEGLHGLTTVYIYVPNMGYQSNQPFAGLKIVDIPDRSNAAARILDVIEGSAAQNTAVAQAAPVAPETPVPAPAAAPTGAAVP